jgi:hypothetical protein
LYKRGFYHGNAADTDDWRQFHWRFYLQIAEKGIAFSRVKKVLEESKEAFKA